MVLDAPERARDERTDSRKPPPSRSLPEKLTQTELVSPWHAAIIHLGLGETERALDLLAEAVDQRSWQVRMPGVEPTFAPLRATPRFIALLERAQLRDPAP